MIGPAAESRGRLVSINTSTGGVPKRPRSEAFIAASGVDGDRHRFASHGGPDRAAVLYSLEIIRALQREGHPIDIGTTGENLTISGLDWAAVAPGTELQIGPVRLLVTKYTTPCDQIRGSFLEDDSSRISQKLHPGWSRVCARVLAEGLVQLGDEVKVDRPRL